MFHTLVFIAPLLCQLPHVHAQPVERIATMKPLYLPTRIVEEGTPRALLVAPADPTYAPAVDTLQAHLKGRVGVALPLRDPDKVTEEDLREFNIIALGNVPDNEFIERLYWQQFLQDTWRPGDEGVAVRSIHNPYNTGRNVIFVGAESARTMPAAVAVLLEHLECEERSAELAGFLIAFEPGRSIPELSDEAKAGYDRRTDDLVKFNNGRGLISGAAAMANNYYNTGSPDYAEMFKLYMAKHESLKGPGSGTHMNLWNAIVGWDRIEESPAFSDEDRLRIANHLLYLLRSKEGTQYGFFQKGITQGGVRHNHQTLPGLDAYFGGRYLKTWGLSEEGDEYIEWARKLFVTQSKHHKPMCDCNQYEWTTLYQTAHWALATGDTAIFDNGMYRVAADRAMIEIDNLGWGACSGDCWTAWSFPLTTLRQAAWHYCDGRYEWMIEKHYGRGKRSVEDWRRGIEPIEPTGLLGIAVAPMDAGFYRLHETTGEPEPNLPLEECFDKLSFRRSFDPEDEYMLIDGIGMGSHGHFDTNCITRMTANSRIWLVDMSYAEGPNMRDHNAITVIRNGLGEKAPPLARLDAVADLDTIGLTQTSVPGYSGLDWRRHILWRKGEYFFVADELEALEEGEYNTRCYWRTLGEPMLDGIELRVAQQAREGAAGVEIIDFEGASSGKVARFCGKQGYLRWQVELAPGTWELAVTARGYTVGSDSFHIDVDGRRVSDVHLSHTKLATSAVPVKIEKAGRHEFVLTLREAPGCIVDRIELTRAGADPIAIEGEDCQYPQPEEPRVDTLTLSSSGIQKLTLVRDADNFGKWWKNYEYAEPVVNILQQQTSGPMKAGELRRFGNLIFVSNGERPKEYRLSKYDRAWAIRGPKGEDVSVLALRPQRALEGVETDAAAVVLSPDRVAACEVTQFRYGPFEFEFGSPVSFEYDTHQGRGVVLSKQATRAKLGGPMTLHRPARPGVVRAPAGGGEAEVVPGRPGEMVRVAAKEIALKAGRNEMSGPKPGSLATELQEVLTGLGDSSRLLGRRPLFPGVNGASKRWEANLETAVHSVAVADLGGDGHRRIIVGCGDSKVRLLDDEGKQLWEFVAGGKINSVCTADVDGDGKLEIIAGSDDRKCYCLNRDGSERWSYEGAATDNPYWRRYWKAGEVEKVIAADIDGDGKDEVIFGAANMNLHALDDDGSLMWKFSRYGVITSLIARDLTGDGAAEVIGGPAKITCVSEVSVLDAKGKRLGASGNDGWASALTAVAIANLDGPGKPAVICGTNFNNVYALDNDGGKLLRRWRFALGDTVTALCGVDFTGEGAELVVAGSASEYVYCLDADGKLRWATPLGGGVLTLQPIPARDPDRQELLAVTDQGVYRLEASGEVVSWHGDLSDVTNAVWSGGVYVGTRSGAVLSVRLE